MTGPLGRDVLERLLAHPSLRDTLTWTQVQRFIRLSRRLWPEILGTSASLPQLLPQNICGFLSSVLSLEFDLVQLSWTAFCDMVPSLESGPNHIQDDDMFRVHGHEFGVGAEAILPPMKTCPRDGCGHAHLSETRRVESRLYTLRRGVLPVFSVSTYCRKCSTRYYHDYSVQHASNSNARREYYGGVPEYMHITESSFMERALCVHNEMQMVFSHASAEGISQIYNLALGIGASDVHNSSRLSDRLHADIILDAFFLHGLLRDVDKSQRRLAVPHAGLQRHRFNNALDERNYRMAGTSQEMWGHACNRCMYVYCGDDGNWYYVFAGVTDGVTDGHACCSIHDCTIPLHSQQHQFCPTHSSHKLLCCVENCSNPVGTSYRTCSEPSHRAFETSRNMANRSMGMLQRRLTRAGLPEIPAAGSSSEPPASFGTASEPGEPSSSIKGCTSRRWTHNEQLFVRCCGVIISCTTFFGSEGVSGVKDFLKVTFPLDFPGSLPSYIFYDNNRNLVAHLLSTRDHYFDKVGLPADVFHSKTKHSETDPLSQAHCNPARFAELIGDNNEWIFNSSAAEQANKWFGGFQSIVREMPVSKLYNFFLDEMIAIRNRFIVAELHCCGRKLHLQPIEVLRGEPS